MRHTRRAVSTLGRRVVAAVACFASIANAGPPGVEAGQPAPSRWRDDWPEFSVVEGVFTVSAGVGTLVLFTAGPSADPRWRGGVLFDDDVRGAMRAEDETVRNRFRRVGDITYYAAPVLPFLVDTLIVSYAIEGDEKLARNLGLVSLEAFAYSGFLSFVSTQVTARERPRVTQCLEDAGTDSEPCDLDSRTEGFWSGHTTIAATSAGLVCANHAYLRLWRHVAADAFACAIASASAATTGVTRIVADEHYATDVLAGSVVGFGIGYAVPTLLHFTAGERRTRAVTAAPIVARDLTGLALAGTF